MLKNDERCRCENRVHGSEAIVPIDNKRPILDIQRFMLKCLTCRIFSLSEIYNKNLDLVAEI